jgi:integrase
MIDQRLSRGVINRRIQCVVRVFRWAASEELIPPSVPEALRTVEGLRKGFTEAREPEPVQPVPDSGIEAILPYLAPIVADMVRVQRLIGARPTEICVMRPRDVDRSGDVWSYRPAAHKNSWRGKPRTIFIGPRAQAILLPYLLRADDAYIFSPIESEQRRRAELHARRQTPLARGNRPGTNRKANPIRKPRKRYTCRSYRRAIYRACDKAGVARWSPNQLRHRAGTEIRSRFGLEAAQCVLGHTRADVTQIYAARDQQQAAEIMREIG